MPLFTFIQHQLLGMQWLSQSIAYGLKQLHIDLSSHWGNALHFFLYDTIKISLLLCFLIFCITYLQSYFPPQRTKRLLGQHHGILGNTLAALLGTVTPFCACSSIPLFIGFTQAKLPLGITFSFLISSPMVDLGSLVLLTSIFGLPIALAYVLLGLLVAIVGGSFIASLHLEQDLSPLCYATPLEDDKDAYLSQKVRLLEAFEQMTFTFKKVFPYILLGVCIGAIIHNWIPEHWITQFLGSNHPFAVLFAVLIGAPIYADIFGTIPIAEALLYKGASLGTILAFMMAVTTLSLPSLIMLRQVLRPRLLWIFISTCLVGILLVGLLFNFIQHLLLL